MYAGREERQEWRVPGAGAGGDGGSEADSGGGGDEGGSLWLPGGCVATFRMVSRPGGGASEHSSGGGDEAWTADTGAQANNGAGGAPGWRPAPRDFVLSLSWLLGEGTCLCVERRYNGAGRLAEARSASSVKGGWSGGRM